MDKLKELMLKLLGEGKSEEEIVAAVAANDEVVAEIPAEGEVATADEIVAEVEKAFKVIKASKSFSEKKANSEKEIAEQKAIDARVKKALEGIKLDVNATPAKEVKYFDHVSKKVVSEKANVSEGLKAFAKLSAYVASGDKVNAKAVEAEIIAEKKKEFEQLGIKTALYSDATTGSYLIPTEVELAIFEKAYQGVMLSRVNTNAVNYNSKLYPVMADMSLGWIADETTVVPDKTSTISNPTVDMKRFGGIALMSNTLLNMPTGLMAAISSQIGSALQRFADLNLVVASATGSGADPIIGIAFDANTKVVTAKNLADVAIEDLTTLKNWIDQKFRSEAIFLANEKVRDAYGLLDDGAGNKMFTQFINTGDFRPIGKEFVVNDQIPSTITVATKEPLTGSSDIIMAIAPSAIYAGFEPLRIATSDHYKFAEDQFAMRVVSRMGVKNISTTGTQGYTAAVQQLS